MSNDKKIEFSVTRRRALGALVTIGAGAAATGAGTFAAFSDTETGSERSVVAGTLDLSMAADGQNNVAATTVTAQAVRPGDAGYLVCALTNNGSVDGSLQIKIGNGNGNADFSDFSYELAVDSDNINTEPEAEVDDDLSTTDDDNNVSNDDDSNTDGELDDVLEMGADYVTTLDTTSSSLGDNTGGTYAGSVDTELATTTDTLPGDYGSFTLTTGETAHLVISYEFPDVDELSDGTDINVVQGDKVGFDVAFRLTQE